MAKWDRRSIPKDLHVHKRVIELLKEPFQKQRGKEWHIERMRGITASKVPSIIKAKGAYQSYNRVFSDYVYQENGEEVDSWQEYAMRQGQELEETAIEMFEEITGKKCFAFGCLWHKDYPWIGGSPDGITHDGYLIEVKCPWRRKIEHELPERYEGQVQILLEICDLEKAYFIQYKKYEPNDGSPGWDILEVSRDREWFKRNFPILKDFWSAVERARKRIEMGDRDIIPKPQKKKIRRDECLIVTS